MTSAVTLSPRDQWAELGYCLYRSLLSADEVDDLLRITERVRRQWLLASAEDGKPGDRDRHNMRHVNHPGYFRDHPDDFVTLMNLIADERILDSRASSWTASRCSARPPSGSSRRPRMRTGRGTATCSS